MAREATVTIANGASLSGAVQLGYPVGPSARGVREVLVGIKMPGSWTSADLTFQVSTDNSAFYDLQTQTGEASAKAAANQWVAVDPNLTRGVGYIKVRSGTAGSPVNQGGARVLTLVFASVR